MQQFSKLQLFLKIGGKIVVDTVWLMKIYNIPALT